MKKIISNERGAIVEYLLILLLLLIVLGIIAFKLFVSGHWIWGSLLSLLLILPALSMLIGTVTHKGNPNSETKEGKVEKEDSF